MTRQVAYRWRLREVMAMNGIYATTDLVPLLGQRGVSLSASQVHRLVTGTPERLNLTVLAALCDILNAEVGELIETSAVEVASARRVVGRRVEDIEPSRPASRRAVEPVNQDPAQHLRPVRVRLLGDGPDATR
ncbi:MAG: helix-turn-helix transcriptional regulator [Actinomycetales bacterium]|nr:helix-turn-helix transcriptional regulator [Actinomycetales bacterium]